MERINQTNKVRSFTGQFFKCRLPVVTILGDSIEVKLTCTFQENDTNAAMACYKADIKDRFGIESGTLIKNCTAKRSEKSTWTFEFTIPVIRKILSLTSAILRIRILASDGRNYLLEYIAIDNTQWLFNGISSGEQNDLEKRIFTSLIKQDNSDRMQSEAKSQASSGNGGVYENTANPGLVIPELEPFKNALLREKYFLQKEGGRKYKLTDGKKLGTDLRGLTTYTFDMESELFLSDDAPIILQVGLVEARGSVLVCEGFSITIMVDRDFGETINSANMSVEPWKLLEAQVNRLNTITVRDRLVVKIIKDGPKFSTGDSISRVDRGQSTARNKIEHSDVTVIWGPPGTGKSYTMANVAIDYLLRNKTVLMVSHSNISVDGVVEQVVKQISQRPDAIKLHKEWLEKGKILRGGYVRDEKLAENRRVVAYNYALDKNPDIKYEMKSLTEEKKRLKDAKREGQRLADIEKKLKVLRGKIRLAEMDYLNKASMVATTISKVTVDKSFEDRKFDVVMFDEISMAYVTQVFCAAMLAREKVICVGDFNQLAPIAQSEAKKMLQTDLFSYLGIVDSSGNIHNHGWLVMLDEQRRMFPEISRFPNKYVYSGLLRDHPDTARKGTIVRRDPLAGRAMNFVDLAGTYCVADKNNDNSRFNVVSALISFAIAKKANVTGDKEEIGIITPYAAQARLIKSMIQDELGSNTAAISCATVHQFQGSERDMIIFDAVESYPGTQAGILMSRNENRSLSRLINVAITRARGKLVVIGNSQFWLNILHGQQNLFVQLVKYMISNSKVIRHAEDRSLEQLLKTLSFGKNIRYFNELNTAQPTLINDINRAKSRIVVSISDPEVMEDNRGVLEALLTVEKNNIKVQVKANNHSELPDAWKKISAPTENAVLPLIVIDDSIVWYGIPHTKGTFKGRGNSKYVTVCPLYFRIAGKHTVGMIRSLTDIDMCVIDGIRKPIQKNKTNPSANNGPALSSSGIHAYVDRYVRCSSCGSATKITRSGRGKVYLKCPSCKNMDYLTKETVNTYIDHSGATCPMCHSSIKAGVSRFGIYVRCSNGHFPSADEI